MVSQRILSSKLCLLLFKKTTSRTFNLWTSTLQDTVVTAGNLILGKSGTQVQKNHCDFHA